jgi:hypothetical protein
MSPLPGWRMFSWMNMGCKYCQYPMDMFPIFRFTFAKQGYTEFHLEMRR